MKSSLEKKAIIEGLTYYVYKPSITKPFYINMESLSLRRRIRLLMAYFAGYEVYYVAIGKEFIGYCLVQSGSDRRYTFATKEDIIVGPYFIREDYRGKKLSISLLKYVLYTAETNFKNAYDYIHKDNIPSIKASKAVGFKYMSGAKISKLTRQISLCDSNTGEYLIFRLSKQL
jgi:RimJ/RimL family protein N-acetyltransferase